MMSLSGWGYCFLAGAKEDGRWKHSPVTIQSKEKSGFEGSTEEFIKLNPTIEHHMLNRVKVCPHCGKSCGYTLNACNNCACDISLEHITFTKNALMGFVYGIKAFPTSIRYEDQNILVYDDLMQTTLIHLNSIATNVYVPDFRYLFSDPRRGLELIDSLFDAATKAAVDMLAHEPFRRKFFSDKAIALMHEEGTESFVRKNVLCGCNYPPSQFQLHLQFILPPYVPYHAVLLAEGKHSDMERFFVVDYIRECLDIMVKRCITLPMSDIAHLTGRELIAVLRATVDTDYYRSFYDALKLHKHNDKVFSNWKSEDFEYVVVDKHVVLPIEVMNGNSAGPVECKVSELVERDKGAISSFGKGAGMRYYSHTKRPGEVSDWHHFNT